MKIFFLTLLFTFHLCIYAQNEETQKTKKAKTLGVQVNPYFKSAEEQGWAFGLRYAVDIHKHFTLGFELVGNTYDNPSYNTKKAGVSLLMRYNIVETGKIAWFTELDILAWYGYWDFKEFKEEYLGDYPYYNYDGTYTQFSWFFAPGMRIPFANKKLSVDLMIKVSNTPVLFGTWKLAPTFRFNIHF